MLILVILAVILIFGFLVFVHELGHFVAARRSGVDVHEFGFGFPPRLYGKKLGRTVYSINALPLGGFVKLKGENLTDKSSGSFGAASFWGKTKILFAGVAMNALTAYVVLVWLCVTGLPPVIPGQFSYGTQSQAQPKRVMVLDVVKNSPAEQAGIKKGDKILGATDDGATLATFETAQDLVGFTKDNAGDQVNLNVLRRGEDAPQAVNVQLRGTDSKEGHLGVTPFETSQIKYGFFDGLVTAAGLTLQLMWATLAAFGGMIAGLFTQGQVSQNVAGPVGIVVILKNVMDFGIPYVLMFVASISISLAVVNALPLPALDGGRWLLAAVQRFTRRQLSDRAEGIVHAAGFFALIALMVVITFFDIKRLG